MINYFVSGDVSTEVREKRQTGTKYIDDRKVVCYYANWAVYRQGDAKFTPQNINPYLCTHLIYAFGGLGKDDTLVPFDEYQDIEKGEIATMRSTGESNGLEVFFRGSCSPTL